MRKRKWLMRQLLFGAIGREVVGRWEGIYLAVQLRAEYRGDAHGLFVIETS